MQKTTLGRLVSLLFMFVSMGVYAQTPDHPLHENHFKQQESVENETVKIDFYDAHAQQKFCQAKLSITNKSDDYVLVNLGEFVFTFDKTTFRPKPKQIIVAPHDVEKITVKVDGDFNFHVQALTMEIAGLSKLPTAGTAITADLYPIPTGNKTFAIGNFQMTLIKAVKEDKVTHQVFSCKYIGNKVGIVEPKYIVFATEKGEMPNDYKWDRASIMHTNETEKVNASMHISTSVLSMETAKMSIDWKNAFKETDPVALTGFTINYELDPLLTATKNK